ncbi:hypothetical protein J3R83DRAFT_247 [Lanmaoa asiatica]|nr:hypothetical protein J3R83DRAFT_247 [Lanmaoa asiatica]
MIAPVTHTEPRDLIIHLGDAHVYKDHITALETQPNENLFPTIRFAREMARIDKFEYDDIIVEGYDPHQTIPMKMSM